MADWRDDKVGSEAHLVEIDGEMVLPTWLCGGPWSSDAQHGSAVAATLAWAVEQVELPVPMRPVRFTTDLLSPVPLTPLRWETTTVKAGKRIAVVDAALWDGDRIAARANCLLMRSGETVDVPVDLAPAEPPVPPHEPVVDELDLPFDPPGFAYAMDFQRMRPVVSGGPPSSAWMRLRCDVVAGNPVTPFQWITAAADMGSQLGGFLPYSDFRTINADFSLHILRLPASAWVGLVGEHHVSADAVGQTSAALFDEEGLLARLLSSVHIDRWSS